MIGCSARRHVECEPCQVGRRPRVDGPYHREPFRHFANQAEDMRKAIRIVHVRGAMQRHQRETAVERQQIRRERRPRQRIHQRIDHQVADEVNAIPGDPLAQQVAFRTALRRVEQVGDLVRQDPVDLLRHRAVETAQPRLHVRHRDVLLDSHQAAGERRIHVADDDDARRLQAVEHGLEVLHHVGRLDGMRAGADVQVDVRRREARGLRRRGPSCVRRSVARYAATPRTAGRHGHEARAAAAPSS